MEDYDAESIMNGAASILEDFFGKDCLFVIVALTEDQTRTHYASNIERSDAIEALEELLESLKDKQRNHTLN